MEADRGKGDEKVGTSMLERDETRSGVSAEIKIVPTLAWVLAGICFIAAQLFFNVVLAHHHPTAPRPWARPLLGLLAGVSGGVFILLIGYINRDAKRRGMSPTLWTIIALIIPNALGIILYFLLRVPLRSLCPQCSQSVQPGFSFCPHCSYKLTPSCPQCQRAVAVTDIYCPYCGTSLRSPTTLSTPNVTTEGKQ
ncbi:MAG: double zinc ribbon domain-containing protein [Ktedonobacterales bacterium]